MMMDRTPRRGVARLLVIPLMSALAAGAARAQTPAEASPPDTLVLDTLLTEEEVVARALEASPLVAQGESAVRATRSGRRVARGAFLPTLSATSVLSRSDVSANAPFSSITDQDSYGGGLTASLDLFTGGRRGADMARSDAEARAAEADLVADRYAVVLGAKRAYFEVLRAGELVRVANARIARAELGLRIARGRQKAGTATRSDGLRAQLELTGGREQLNAARDTLQSAAYALGRLVGAEGPVGARAPASLDPRPLSQTDSAIVRMAVHEAPGVRAAEAAAEAGHAATRSARAQYFPGLKLTGGYLWANRSPIPGALRPGWTLALGTSFPLFNGFVREDAQTRAAAAADVADAVEADARRQARADANRLLGALRLAREGIDLARDAVTSAQEDLRVQTERYEAGLSTMLDALTSQSALVQAELGLVAARHRYQIVRASLEALVGREL
ncbi:MAG TPA: TolC family protein [Longimicrobiales bacterium]|nr:TolC family protein [Longimicrobiales bacterium]